jgi:hypothetical protein
MGWERREERGKRILGSSKKPLGKELLAGTGAGAGSGVGSGASCAASSAGPSPSPFPSPPASSLSPSPSPDASKNPAGSSDAGALGSESVYCSEKGEMEGEER